MRTEKRKSYRKIVLILGLVFACYLGVVNVSAKKTTFVGTFKMFKGQEGVLRYTANPDSKVKWSIKNSKIGKLKTMDNKAYITAKKNGSTYVYATYKGKKYSYKMNVVKTKKVYLSTTAFNIYKNKKHTLKIFNAKGKITWSVKNKKIVSIKGKKNRCKITAKKVGSTIVTAKAKGKKYKCKVSVLSSTGSSNSLTPEAKALNAVNKLFSTDTKTVTAKAGAATTIGSLSKDNYEIVIPAGTFAADTKVTVVSNGNILSIKAGDKDYARLEAPVTIRMALSGKVSSADLPYVKVNYIFNNTDYYATPDISKLRNGVLEFTTDHFSDYAALKIAKKHLIKNQAKLEAINNYTMGQQCDIAGSIIEKFAGGVLDDMGVTKDRGWGDVREKIEKSLGRSADFIYLLRTGAAGNEADFTTKATEVIAKTVVENIDKQAWFSYATAAAGTVPSVITDVSEGKYADAATSVMKAVASNITVVKVVQFYDEIWEAQIQDWTDKGMENAFQAYSGNTKGLHGYDGNHPTTDGEWTAFTGQMTFVYRDYITKELEQYRKALGMSKAEFDSDTTLKNKLRGIADSKLRAQFEARYKKNAEIEARAKENEALIEAFYDQGLMSYDGGYYFNDGDDEVLRLGRLMNIYNSVRGLFGDATPASCLGYNTGNSSADVITKTNNKAYAELVALWVKNAWKTGGNAVDARTAVLEELAKTYGVGVSFAPEKIELDVGQSTQIVVSNMNGAVSPSEVKWASADKAIAKVDTSGIVTGVSDGNTTITIAYGKKTYSYAVKVGKPSLTLSQVQMIMYVGATDTLYVDEAVSGLKWSSSDDSVASVSSGGTVTAKKFGVATITATAGKDSGTCKVYVVDPKLSTSSVTVAPGSEVTVTLTGIHDTNVEFGLSDTTYASITQKGASCTIKGLKNGTTTLSAWWMGDEFKCSVTVGTADISIKGFKGDYLSFAFSRDYLGITDDMYLDGVPDSEKNKVTWESSCPTFYSIDSNGHGTLKGQFADKEYTVVIRATYNGKYYYQNIRICGYESTDYGVSHYPDSYEPEEKPYYPDVAPERVVKYPS